MVDIPGKTLDAETAAFLREHEIRAVCLFRKNLGSEDEIRRLTADLREVMGPLGLIGIDQEGGSVIRATSVPQAPAAMALGAIGDEALAEEVGAAVARSLRHLGINWNFAPVLDVNNNPANPVIGERSFGEDPEQVIRLARAWMRGSLRRAWPAASSISRPWRYPCGLAPCPAHGGQVPGRAGSPGAAPLPRPGLGG